jgi:peptidoglycan/LPS O-acetylase OafA/YrhL
MSAARLWSRVVDELWTRPPQNFAPLDGLRGFASCIVVFYHCVMFTGFLQAGSLEAAESPWLPRLANGFWTGIDIFFVLSGFLIGRLLIRDLERDGRLYYPSFFIRRGFRIFPAYYFVLTASLLFILPLDIPVFRFLFASSDWREVAGASWSNYLYVVNYVAPGSMPSPMSWAWSLCVEEHFYALLPLVLFLVYRVPGVSLRPTLLALFVLAPLAGRAIQYVADPSLELMRGFYYYSHNRFDELFVGVCIAYLFVTRREVFRRWAERAGSWLWIGGFACAAAVWVFGGLQRGGAFAVVAQFSVMALGTGLLVVNCLFLPNAVTRFFAHPFWYPLARLSYGTYLIHLFVLFALLGLQVGGGGTRGGWSIVGLYVLTMALSSLLAAVMFLALEAPMLRLGVSLSAGSRARAGAWETRGGKVAPAPQTHQPGLS